MKNLEQIILKSLKGQKKTIDCLHRETLISHHALSIIINSLIKRGIIQNDNNKYLCAESIKTKINGLDLEYRQFINPSDPSLSTLTPMDESDRKTLKDILKSLNQFLSYCQKKNQSLPIKEAEYFYFGNFKISEFTSSF